jgi:proline iminopeptidase
MKKHISTLFVVLVSLCAAVGVWADEPGEGYILTPDKVRIFYKIVGSGPETLVVVHGGPGNSIESIRVDLEPLAKGRRVIYYDQRGNGRSELIKDGKKLGVDKHVADLEAVREHFKLDKMTLLGNSWGGLLISLYAVAHPNRVERMVLHDPAEPSQKFLFDAVDEINARIYSRYKGEKLERYKLVSRPETWMNAKDPKAICREFFELLFPTYIAGNDLGQRFKGDVCFGSDEAVRLQQYVNGQVWRSLGKYDLVPQLGKVTVPVLVIHGVADPIPVESSEAWAYGYPNARLLLVQNAGHITHVERPDIFFPAVETFLEGSFPADAKKVERPSQP